MTIFKKKNIECSFKSHLIGLKNIFKNAFNMNLIYNQFSINMTYMKLSVWNKIH